MNNNYMTYPLKYMRITCRYDEYSHRNHNVKVTDNNIDYPIDDGGIDSERDPIYCPCDEMRVTAIRGIGSGSTNTIWLVSTTPVTTPTFNDIAYMTLTHSNDSDFKNIKVGDTFKRGDIICYEGTDGATNNHIHMTCGRGSSNNWKKNSNGSWIMSGDAKKPEEVFYINTKFTTILNTRNINWINLSQKTKVGSPVERNKNVEQIEVIVDNLNARNEPTKNSPTNGYINRGIYNVLETKDNEEYRWIKVEDYWIATKDEWTIYYPKETSDCETQLNELKQLLPRLIFNCNRTGKYIIHLEKGNSLYLK